MAFRRRMRASKKGQTNRSEKGARSTSLKDHLHHALKIAQDWIALEQLLAQAQTGYQRGDLTQTQGEDLAQEAAVRSRTLPEKTPPPPTARFLRTGRLPCPPLPFQRAMK